MLPIVKQETMASLLATLSGDLRGTNDRVYVKIKDENPVLWSLIAAVIEDDKYSEDFKEGYCKAAAHFYGLLSRQDESDQMQRDWGGV